MATIDYQPGWNVKGSHPDSELVLIAMADPWIQPSTGYKKKRGLFLCSCGSTTVAMMSNVTAGKSRTCGHILGEAQRTHGMFGTPFYQCWADMKRRSEETPRRDEAYPTYIGVGREQRWDVFENFRDDKLTTYFEGAVLGRIGDTGDYTNENSRWMSKEDSSREMMENSGRMHMTSDGRYAIDLAIERGITMNQYYYRIRKGMSPDDACSTNTEDL